MFSGKKTQDINVDINHEHNLYYRKQAWAVVQKHF